MLIFTYILPYINWCRISSINSNTWNIGVGRWNVSLRARPSFRGELLVSWRVWWAACLGELNDNRKIPFISLLRTSKVSWSCVVWIPTFGMSVLHTHGDAGTPKSVGYEAFIFGMIMVTTPIPFPISRTSTFHKCNSLAEKMQNRKVVKTSILSFRRCFLLHIQTQS